MTTSFRHHQVQVPLTQSRSPTNPDPNSLLELVGASPIYIAPLLHHSRQSFKADGKLQLGFIALVDLFDSHLFYFIDFFLIVQTRCNYVKLYERTLLGRHPLAVGA